jgi:hypothetical protein
VLPGFRKDEKNTGHQAKNDRPGNLIVEKRGKITDIIRLTR